MLFTNGENLHLDERALLRESTPIVAHKLPISFEKKLELQASYWQMLIISAVVVSVRI